MKEDNAEFTIHRSATQGDASLAKNAQCTMHEAQWRHQDKNLREALRQEEANLPPMPADLNERLQQRLSASGRGRGVRLLFLAAAASIALLLVFNLGKRQSPQEPVVAQQTEKPAVVPSQPIVEEPQPKVVSDEQPVEKPVTEPSEDAPQATESTSTENVKAPRRFSSQPILDITSSEGEPFFLASTSYMATHKGHRDGLAGTNTPEAGDDDALSLYAAKDKDGMPEGWTELRNWSNDQKVRRKLTKKEKRQAAVVGALAAKRWHIDINSMSTMRYGSRTVTSDFYLELRGDTLRSYLPYLGQAHASPTLSPSIGLNFEEPVQTYKESKPKSNKYTQIDIDVKTREDSYHYVIEIYGNGHAYIRVRSMNRDPISFDGTMDIE